MDIIDFLNIPNYKDFLFFVITTLKLVLVFSISIRLTQNQTKKCQIDKLFNLKFLAFSHAEVNNNKIFKRSGKNIKKHVIKLLS